MVNNKRMVFTAGCCLLAAFLALSQAAADSGAISLTDTISQRDKDRMRQMFLRAEPFSELPMAYYATSGLEVLGFQTQDQKFMANACKFAASHVDASNLESIFYATSTVQAVGNTCRATFTQDAHDTVRRAMDEDVPPVQDIYYAVTAMHNLEMKIDNVSIPAKLLAAVEKEESVLSNGQAFKAAALIPDADLSKIFELIEDTIAQADETPTTLYFEGGLKVTSTVISGVFALAKRVDEDPTISGSQATKFGNYFLLSKYTSSITEAFHVLTAASTLASNEFVVPSALLSAGSQPIGPSNQNLKIRLTNILGEAVGEFTVKIKTIEDPDENVVTKNTPMTPEKDGVTYSYLLYPDVSVPGVYKLTLSTVTTNQDSSVVELTNVPLSVTVSYQATVGTAKLSVVDKDQGVTTKSISLDYPNRSKDTVEADQHTKVAMAFSLLNKDTSEQVTVHQAFVRLSLGSQEIFYVATANSEKQYLFEVDVAEAASDFGQLSGTYDLTLIIGDFALENPFSWDVGMVTLKFSGSPAGKPEESSVYKPKPVIEHMFKIQEKRPPKVVSSTFTILVLTPLGLLIILWLLLGANISDISTGGIWAVFFHIGLAAVFGLYYCFWIQLNMFQTLKYLAVISVFTFVTGNRMLRKIAQAKQQT